ncbi:DUF488 domain-containing protein [Pseudalkalibacillus salsuginis]|uniref:DUF488 domain-containing protein n=1 Tax=Pseudalkalibacillus salsuginis TaxID=2910972 RepID=UPI001F200320|nr:DUF488 domain-containing protein [Pseudalkalibacillus salsuginis]MCF6410805.1 DUF488 domain-containing protein [Pseudalkalibacillus salsuginis]
MEIQLKRIYESKSEKDGQRILIDRVWPRGISKEKADLDVWLKEIAPSTDLRKWFGHVPERFEKFKEQYKKELDHDEEKQEAVEKLRSYLNQGKVTLLYSAKNEKHNHAIVLKEYLS